MWPDNVQKPSEQLSDVLSGRVDMKDAPKAIQSWARFEIYQGAKQVLALPDRAKRQKALASIPERIRPYIKAEAMRLWRSST